MRRFEVWLIMKNPEFGRVVDNLGLCTIVTPNELNKLPSLLVAPMTTSFESIPSRVDCIFEGAKGFIMIDQIRTIEKLCFIKKLGELENDVQINVEVPSDFASKVMSSLDKKVKTTTNKGTKIILLTLLGLMSLVILVFGLKRSSNELDKE